jgi:hypothetical protein
MTELLIDGTSAVLPADFSVQVKIENAFFTRSGEYSYDITLPLDNPTNAELYRHLNRLGVTDTTLTGGGQGQYGQDNQSGQSEPPEQAGQPYMPPVHTLAKSGTRQAVLIADNRVYLRGTEIVTGWTERAVSIQITSGNAELNYLIGDTLYISWLTKMRETYTPYAYEPLIAGRYPEIDFCLAPVVNRTAGYTINNWALWETAATDGGKATAAGGGKARGAFDGGGKGGGGAKGSGQ